MASEFDLLSYVGVEDGELPKTEAERRAEERKRKKAFDEMQYRAHVEQEKRRLQRLEQNFSGKCHRFPHRDTMHHFGNYWFAGGEVPSTHDVVGRAPPPPADRPVAHSMDGVEYTRGVASPRSTNRASSAGASRRGTNPQGSTPPPHQQQQQSHGAYGYSDYAERRPYQKQKDEPVVVLRSRTPPPSAVDVARRAWQREMDNEDGAAAAGPSSPAQRARTPASHVRRGEFSPSRGNPRAAGAPTSPGTSPMQQAPYAQHYEPPEVFSTGGTRPPPHPDRDGVLRGAGGRDEYEAMAREAMLREDDARRRAEHERKKALSAELKRDLDAAVSMKRYVKAEERRNEDRDVFGVTLPIRVADPRSRAEFQRRQREELERTWAQQAAEHRRREEADRLRPSTSDAWWLDAERREQEAAAERSRRLSNDSGGGDAKASWKRAWLEHQQQEASAAKAQRREAERIEDATLSPNIANYADRIMLSERQRKEAQREYQRQLDAQVGERRQERQQQRQRSLIAENYARPNRFSRGPFQTMPSSFA